MMEWMRGALEGHLLGVVNYGKSRAKALRSSWFTRARRILSSEAANQRCRSGKRHHMENVCQTDNPKSFAFNQTHTSLVSQFINIVIQYKYRVSINNCQQLALVIWKFLLYINDFRSLNPPLKTDNIRLIIFVHDAATTINPVAPLITKGRPHVI